MDAIAETTVTGAALRDKLAALGNESYTIDTCERYAEMIAASAERTPLPALGAHRAGRAGMGLACRRSHGTNAVASPGSLPLLALQSLVQPYSLEQTFRRGVEFLSQARKRRA